jgi:hypothetical protein
MILQEQKKDHHQENGARVAYSNLKIDKRSRAIVSNDSARTNKRSSYIFLQEQKKDRHRDNGARVSWASVAGRFPLKISKSTICFSSSSNKWTN